MTRSNRVAEQLAMYACIKHTLVVRNTRCTYSIGKQRDMAGREEVFSRVGHSDGRKCLVTVASGFAMGENAAKGHWALCRSAEWPLRIFRYWIRLVCSNLPWTEYRFRALNLSPWLSPTITSMCLGHLCRNCSSNQTSSAYPVFQIHKQFSKIGQIWDVRRNNMMVGV